MVLSRTMRRLLPTAWQRSQREVCCRTCGLPIWVCWLAMGKPWEPRIKRFHEAADCIDLLPASVGAKLWADAMREVDDILGEEA